MANMLFDSAIKAQLGNGATAIIDWDADVIRAALIDAGTVDPDLTTHAFFNSLSSAVVGTPVTVTPSFIGAGRTVDVADYLFSSVTGASAEELIYYKWTGTASTSPLGLLNDDFSSGMPVTPNGGDIAVAVNGSGAFKVGT